MKALIVAAALLCMAGCDSAPLQVPKAPPQPFTCQELFVARDEYIRRMMRSDFTDNLQANSAAVLALEASLGHCLQ